MIDLNILWQKVLSAKSAKAKADDAFTKAVKEYSAGVKLEVDRLAELGVTISEEQHSQLSPLELAMVSEEG